MIPHLGSRSFAAAQESYSAHMLAPGIESIECHKADPPSPLQPSINGGSQTVGSDDDNATAHTTQIDVSFRPSMDDTL